MVLLLWSCTCVLHSTAVPFEKWSDCWCIDINGFIILVGFVWRPYECHNVLHMSLLTFDYNWYHDALSVPSPPHLPFSFSRCLIKSFKHQLDFTNHSSRVATVKNLPTWPAVHSTRTTHRCALLAAEASELGPLLTTQMGLLQGGQWFWSWWSATQTHYMTVHSCSKQT